MGDLCYTSKVLRDFTVLVEVWHHYKEVQRGGTCGFMTKCQPTYYLSRFHDEPDAKATGILSHLEEGQPDKQRHNMGCRSVMWIYMQWWTTARCTAKCNLSPRDEREREKKKREEGEQTDTAYVVWPYLEIPQLITHLTEAVIFCLIELLCSFYILSRMKFMRRKWWSWASTQGQSNPKVNVLSVHHIQVGWPGRQSIHTQAHKRGF